MIGRLLLLAVFGGLTAGCKNFKFPGLLGLLPDGPPIETRIPIPVDAEVDKILTDWQARHAKTKTVYAEFNWTNKDRAFKQERKTTGTLRLRHPDAGRLDLKGQSMLLMTPKGEFWWAERERRTAEVFEPTSYDVGKADLFGTLSDTPFIWFTAADKKTIQRQGSVKKIEENDSQIVLRITRTKDSGHWFFERMTVHLRKPDLTAVKLILEDTPDTEVTYEFTGVHENIELDDAQFAPPKLKAEEWKITRHSASEKTKKKIAK